MANETIGLICCPTCDHPAAHVRESVKKKAYIVCSECGSQTFARGPRANTNIRQRMRPVDQDPAPNDTPAPADKNRPIESRGDLPTPPAKGFGTWLGL